MCVAGALALASCSDKKSPTQPPPPPPVEPARTLTIVAGQGVQVVATAGEHPHGSDVPYQVQALPGYGTPDVVVDSLVVAAGGTLRMDRNHVLYASAPAATATVPASDPVLTSARRVLTATDPVAAWGEHLQRVATLVAEVPADSAHRHLARVSALAFDWARDGDAIMRVSAALHGKVFAFAPSNAASGAAARFQAAVTEAEQVRTAFVYTNGMNNTLDAAQGGMAALAQAARASGRGTLVQMPNGSLPVPAAPRVVYLVNYNHSAMLPFAGDYCAWKVLSAIAERGAAYAWKLFWMTTTQREHELGCTTRTDLWESVTQMARQLLNVPTAVPADAQRLASLTMAWRREGYNVVMTAHSQGNLMTLDALASVQPVRAGQPTCVSFISLASPLFPGTIPNVMRSAGITIKHGRAEDFIMKVPGAKSPTLSTQYAREMEGNLPSSLWFLALGGWTASYAMEVFAGFRLHSLEESYLRSGESRDWIIGRLGNDYQFLADACGGRFEGRVVDGETRQPIAGARLRTADATSPVATTDAAGTYVTSMLQARRQTLIVEAEGYESVTLHGVEPAQLDTTVLAEVPLVRTSPHPGAIAGRIRNARSLAAIPGAGVTLRRGINAITGDVAATGTTGADGRYSITGVPAGTYTMQVSATGFVTETRTGIVIGERVTAGQDLDLSPDDLDLRIKLTWSSTPADLDSHLTGPLQSGSRFRVYYSSPGSLTGPPYAALDVDDVNGHGPETVTVVQEVSGTYRYSVHDFTNRSSTSSTALARSAAQVVVYRRGQVIASFSVPNQPGTTWTVFEMANGVIQPVNTVGYAYPAVRAGTGEGPEPTPAPKTRGR
ncbi:MAG TPA: carboxypeptidase regulatory-like domain-containing protein [Longimicrobium sp.]